ncbi:hypothetical protein [Streptosporangium sp. NPDC051022]|uniref:hypothetical protein n=1 Tax=Streptosporangium sp. NPDC051022 TaxID=3155752 RepID=UPI003426150B
MLTRTYTKTYTLMHAWAETVVHTKNTIGVSKAVREDAPCCAPECDELLVAGEVAYSPVELERTHANPGRGEPWVCWRHIRPDDGPLRVS